MTRQISIIFRRASFPNFEIFQIVRCSTLKNKFNETYGSVRLITLLNMCNGTEGKKTAVWGWWGALGNLATAPLEETPHTPGTTWQHKPIRVPASAPFFLPRYGGRKKRIQFRAKYRIIEPRYGGNKSFHRHGCASGFPKIHPKLSVDLKEISSGRQAVFQQVFFSNGTENPLLIGRYHV